MKKSKKKIAKFDKRSVSRAYALLTTLAINLVVIMVAMLLIGSYLDKRFDTSPIFLFIFLLLGIGASFRNIYVLSMSSLPKQKKKYEYIEEESNKDNE